ncbi:hypothetical protein ANN_24222 [Periplaneta americana]|uniref:Uncharacterized protein n=1 Tax=Periplaneta americana TaxID=6978 RepID=A0ABQ8S2V2_PERAM|nr:hypothetical protein ANN_24222 [Periplaneta americana]
MNANVATVCSIPGWSLDRNQCTHCPDTGQVLGQSEREMFLHNSTYHVVRSTLATALKKKGWTVEEVSCLAPN